MISETRTLPHPDPGDQHRASLRDTVMDVMGPVKSEARDAEDGAETSVPGSPAAAMSPRAKRMSGGIAKHDDSPRHSRFRQHSSLEIHDRAKMAKVRGVGGHI